MGRPTWHVAVDVVLVAGCLSLCIASLVSSKWIDVDYPNHSGPEESFSLSKLRTMDDIYAERSRARGRRYDYNTMETPKAATMATASLAVQIVAGAGVVGMAVWWAVKDYSALLFTVIGSVVLVASGVFTMAGCIRCLVVAKDDADTLDIDVHQQKGFYLGLLAGMVAVLHSGLVVYLFWRTRRGAEAPPKNATVL